MKYSWLAIGFACVSHWSTGAFGAEVSFKYLVSQLPSQNPKIQRTDAAYQSANIAKESADWQLAPTVTWRSVKSWQKEPEDSGWPANSVSHILGLSWQVFDGFSTWHQLDQADLTLQKAEFDTVVAKATVYAALAAAYLDWQSAVALVDIQKELVKIREDNWKKVSVRVRRGELQKQETLLFQNQLLDARDRLIQAETTRNRAVQALYTLLPQQKFDPVGHTPSRNDLFGKNYCEEVKDRLALHPSIQSLVYLEKIAETQHADASSTYYPSVTLGVDQRFHAWVSDVESPERNQTTFQATFSWTLFDGFSTSYDRRLAVLQQTDARLARDVGLIDLRNTVEQNCLRLANLDQRIKNSAEIVENYQELYKQGEQQFSVAGLSSLDLIRLQTDLLNAKLQTVQLQIDRQKVRLEQVLIFDPQGFPTAF